MENGYSIGQLADAAGVPVSTLRYYERIKLLCPAGRTGGNYRYYDDESLALLKFIKAAQATGFTLDDIRTLLGLRDDDRQACDEVQSLIEDRLQGVRNRIQELQGFERVLKTSLQQCRKSSGTGRCVVIDSISKHT